MCCSRDASAAVQGVGQQVCCGCGTGQTARAGALQWRPHSRQQLSKAGHMQQHMQGLDAGCKVGLHSAHALVSMASAWPCPNTG